MTNKITIFKHNGDIWKEISDPKHWTVDERGALNITIPEDDGIVNTILTTLPYYIERKQ
jgi:hypothetical protein